MGCEPPRPGSGSCIPGPFQEGPWFPGWTWPSPSPSPSPARADDPKSWHGTNLKGAMRGLILGIAARDLHHAGPIQIIKRLGGP